MISGGSIISHSCSWIRVYVLCCNAQVNLIVILMACTCIIMHSSFCQLPNCNLFTQLIIYLYGETPLVNYGPWSILLHILLYTTSTIYFSQLFIYLLQTNIIFHTIRLILCYQQIGEIDNLTASWGQSILVVLCAGSTLLLTQTPHHQRHLLAPLPKSASNNLRKWFLSPTGRLNLGFILRENLLLCSSYLPLGVPQLAL
jgi:hypothetical protein